MPCTGGCNTPVPETVTVDHHKKVCAERDLATRLLCAVMQTLDVAKRTESTYACLPLDVKKGELEKWWSDHQKLDKKRKEQEALDKEIADIEKKLANLKSKRSK